MREYVIRPKSCNGEKYGTLGWLDKARWGHKIAMYDDSGILYLNIVKEDKIEDWVVGKEADFGKDYKLVYKEFTQPAWLAVGEAIEKWIKDENEIRKSLDNIHLCPEFCKDSVHEYLRKGVMTCSGFESILTGDLFLFAKSMGCPYELLKQTLEWLNQYFPKHCWGSKEAVRTWVEINEYKPVLKSSYEN